METYNGQVRTPTDAIILFEACRMGILPRVQRRLSEKERQSIRSGSVFVWDEREAGMRRWTDGKSWSASRVSGSFLTYREMEGKRGGSSFVTPAPSRATKTPDSGRNSAEDGGADGEEGPDGYRYKPDGLMKQSFSITTSQGQHLHLISYYSRSHPTAQSMRQPSTDPSLSSIQIPKGMYPESTVNDQTNTPAVTRSPMPGAPNYVMAPSPNYGKVPPPPPPPHAYYPGFIPHPAGYVYPISPLHTPPGAYAIHPYPHHAGLPPLGYGPAPYGHPQIHVAAPPPIAYDQRPLRNSLVGGNSPQPAPTLQHSLSAPATSPLPPPQLSPSATATSQMLSRSPNVHPVHNTVTTQIDPRLTETVTTAIDNRAIETGAIRETKSELQSHYAYAPPTTASQVPTINALVHSTNLATKSPVVVTEVALPDKENDRQGSTSPGGTKIGVPPQDIPSEKLGFREDMRALSKLDRVFARV